MQAANLVSRFGLVDDAPRSRSTSTGDMSAYSAVDLRGLYRTTKPLPAAFLADVAAGTVPVLWMYDNI